MTISISATNWADVVLVISWATKALALVAVVGTGAATAWQVVKTLLALLHIAPSGVASTIVTGIFSALSVAYLLVTQQGCPWWAAIFGAGLAVFAPGLAHDLGQIVALFAQTRMQALRVKKAELKVKLAAAAPKQRKA